MLEKRKTTTTRNLIGSYYLVLVGIILYIVLDVVAQSLPPHYSAISQAESDLAVGRFGIIMGVNFVNRGLFSLLFIFALLATLDLAGLVRRTFRGGVSLLGVWGVGSMVLAAFPTDVPPTALSDHGAVHLVVAVVAFLCGAFGTLEVSRKLGKSNEFRTLARKVALPLSLVVMAAWLIEFILPFVAPHVNSRIGGLTERLFLGAMLLWLGGVSTYLAKYVSEFKAGITATSAS